MRDKTTYPATLEAAIEVGEKYFFPGTPCAHGHVEAYRLKEGKRKGACRECERIKNRERNRKNKKRVRETTAAWTARNKEYSSRWAAEWYLRNRERLKPVRKKWDAANTHKRKVIHARYWKSGKAKAAQSVWRQKNAERWKIIRANIKAKRRSENGTFSPADVRRIYRLQHGRCAYCRSKLGNRYEIDHILPVALRGTNFPANLQLCCVSCNRTKNAKHPITFVQEMGMLI